MNTKLELKDNVITVVTKMSEGNPGALNILMQLLSTSNDIEPDNLMGGMGTILNLDSYGIYGSDIYVLFNDICDSDLVLFTAVLRACQLGLFDARVLSDATQRQDRTGRNMIPVNDLYEQVREKLPSFKTTLQLV